MITNREIASRELLDEALDELVDSARENGVADDEIAAALRVRATRTADGANGENGENGGNEASGTADGANDGVEIEEGS
ncbi:hypothetical protein GRX01_13320 [Halobaculum sp. WSA2]|uniref:Uncharacterized protein n=1 Tax=Halobaculum saliterrae TaxID=2073113 RepID=A0A6B0T0I8_9EURY|nr:hypothetical protein [Halobaculum saliterrae]MXR42313.1 hypothetical protein [Halobaculum saliterrae]